MTETEDKKHIFLQIVYIVILAASAMGDMPDFSFAMTRVMKALSILIVVIGAVILFVSGNLDRVKTAGRFVGVYAFVLVGIIVWSILLWIINLETVEFIIRGATKFMYQFLVLLIIFAGAYMFGERAIYTTFYGLALANTSMLLINMVSFGPAESINSVITMITGGQQAGFVRAMEVHDITFTFGFFVIYFLFFAQHNKERVIDILIALFYFFLGWKRIAMAAMPIAVIMAFVLGRIRSKYRISLMKIIAWTFVLFSFAYVTATRFGWFEMITNQLGIDTMGRNEIYKYIENYYNISLGFIGYGFEYTTVILQKVVQTNPDAHIGVFALHNNILTLYIELGFIGFWAWMIYTWIFQLNWMLNHWGEKVAMLFFLCELYIFITYTTDNTLYYYYSSLVLRLMPMGYAFHKRTEQDIKLWPWVKAREPLLKGD